MAKSVFSEAYGAMLQALVAARKQKGIKQTELASRLGKPQSFISKIERGERRLDPVELIVVARAIGIDVNEIMDIAAAGLPADARL